MTRADIRMYPYFRAVYVSSLEEIEGLALDVYYGDDPAVLETYTPLPSVEDPGLQSALITFAMTGVYRLHWRAADPEFSVWDTVYVSNSSDPAVVRSLHATGTVWHPEVPAHTPPALYAVVYGPDMVRRTHDLGGRGSLGPTGVLTDSTTDFISLGVRAGDTLTLTPASSGPIYVDAVISSTSLQLAGELTLPLTPTPVDYVISASVFPANDSPPNHRTVDPVVPDVAGTWLVQWYSATPEDQASFLAYTVLDVFSPADERPVAIALKNTQGQPLPSVHVTVTRLDGAMAFTSKTDTSGRAYFQLANGGYYVTLTDTVHTTRVFDKNNMEITVEPPLPANPTILDREGNLVPQFPDSLQWTYTVSWLDLTRPVVPVSIVPSADRSWMAVQVAVGPEGVPSMFRRFTVEQLTPIRLTTSGYIVAPGETVCSLDAAGKARIPLIRGARVRVSFAAANLAMTFTVPNQEEFNLVDVQSADPFGVTLPRVFYPYRTSP